MSNVGESIEGLT